MPKRDEIIQHLREELEFGERMRLKHLFDGHPQAATVRLKHIKKLATWIEWLEKGA